MASSSPGLPADKKSCIEIPVYLYPEVISKRTGFTHQRSSYVSALYQEFQRDCVVLARKISKSLKINCFHIISVDRKKYDEYVTLICTVSNKDELNQLLSAYTDGQLKREIVDYAISIGFEILLDICPGDIYKEMTFFVFIDKKKYEDEKKHFIASVGGVDTSTQESQGERGKEMKDQRTASFGDGKSADKPLPYSSTSQSNGQNDRNDTSATKLQNETMVMKKHFRVYIPVETKDAKRVMLKSKDCKHVLGQLTNIAGTYLWEVEISIPADTGHFLYWYETEVVKSSKFIFFTISGTEYVLQSQYFTSQSSHEQFDISNSPTENVIPHGYVCLCLEILKKTMSSSLKDHIMQLERLRNKQSFIDNSTAHWIVSTAERTLQEQHIPICGPLALAFIVFVGQTMGVSSHSSYQNCVSKETANSLLRQCSTAKFDDIPTKSRKELPSVLENLCKVALEDRYSFVAFISFTYPFLPVETFSDMLKRVGNTGLPVCTSTTQCSEIWSVFQSVLYQAQKRSPSKNEEHFLASFQRKLPLEIQLDIVRNFGSRLDPDNTIYSEAVQIVHAQCHVSLSTEGKQGDMQRVIQLWDLMGGYNYINLEKIQKKMEDVIFSVLEKLKATQAKNCYKELQSLCQSGSVFQDKISKIDLLQKLATSKHEEIHYIYLTCLKSKYFEDIDDDAINKLTDVWFQTAERYCTCLKKDPKKAIVYLYGYIGDLMSCDKVRSLKVMKTCQDNAFDFLCQFDIQVILNAISDIEEMKEEAVEDLYRTHVEKILKETLTNRKSSIADFSKKIAGTTSLKVNSSITCGTWTTVMECTGLKDDMPMEDAFCLILDYKELWKEIYEAKGSKVYILHKHKVYQDAKRVIDQVGKDITSQTIRICFFKKLQPRFDACKYLFDRMGIDMKQLVTSWDKLNTCLEEIWSNLKTIMKVIHNIKNNMSSTDEISEAIDCVLQVLLEKDQEIKTGCLTITEIKRSINDISIPTDTIKACQFLENTIQSKVFWNMFFKNRNKFQHDFEEDSSFSKESLGLSLLFNEECVFELKDESNNRMYDIAFALVNYLGNDALWDYKDFWDPLLIGNDKDICEIHQLFQGASLENEIELAAQHCRLNCASDVHNALKMYYDFKVHSEKVTTMKETLVAFKMDYSTDETFMEAVCAYQKLIKHEIADLTLLKVGRNLQSVVKISEMLTPLMKDILSEVNRSSTLIDFLKEVLQEDIRNLIDAVEEHSEQYVRESTVSALIDVKRFFQPLLKVQYGNNVMEFFSALKRTSETSDSNSVPHKIHECMSNLHSLKALYKNVANRGERTREIIDAIVKHGKFSFKLIGITCEVSVQYKQDKKQQHHKEAFLNDLRSRALLIVNTEEKQRTKATTKDQLHLFVDLIDVALDISCICVNLKKSGHFSYSEYEMKVQGSKKNLLELHHKLQEQYDTWCKNLMEVRKKYIGMNFIYSGQLQLLYEFFNTGKKQQEALSILKYIHPNVCKLDELPENSFSDLESDDTMEKLESMGNILDAMFATLKPVQRIFEINKTSDRMTDIVQPGRLCIAALEENSTLVVRTILALYLNTTGRIPQPHQILFCSKETSPDEFELLLQRCCRCTDQELYCIANVELLSSELQFHFVEELQKLPHLSHYLLAIICRGNIHHNFFDKFSDHVVHARPLTDVQVKECFEKQWPYVTTVTSDVPGLGKTEIIRKIATSRDTSPVTIHISGSVSKKKIVEQLVSLGVKRYHCLHFDIGSVEDPFALDIFLFELIVLQYVSSGTSSFVLNTENICIEIANSINYTLSNSLSTATSFQRKNLQWENYDNLKVSQEISSPVQVVCHYLQALDQGKIDENDLYFSGCKKLQALTGDRCKALLRKHFATSGDMSFAIVNIFVNVLADQLKKLSTSMFFRTSNLQQKSAKSELVKALISMSEDFSSRSINSCRLMQSSTLLTDVNQDEISMAVPKSNSSSEILAKRVEGMIRWEDSNHLMILFHQDLQTVSALFRNKSNVPKHIKELFKSQLGRELQDFHLKEQVELQMILQKLARQNLERIPKDMLEKMSENYALTADNLLKMVLISLRMKGHVPVIIMGETGCGKTSLVKYLANICDVRFEVLSIHAGVTEDSIISKVKECNDIAKKSFKDPIWLFLDEINTCNHLGIISDIVCHHKCFDVRLAPNLTVIAACNPYRLRNQESIFTSGLQGKIKSDELSRLVYRVYPLPETMVDYVWDYGSLNAKDERAYIERMVHKVLENKKCTDLLAKLLTMSQEFVRNVEGNDCSVSLRDVERCKKLVVWFSKILHQKNSYQMLSSKTYSGHQEVIRAIVLSLAICYHSRFTENDVRRKYRQEIANIVDENFMKSQEDVASIIIKEENDILDRMEIPVGTAKNTALRENVFVTLVCILNRIPVFVVGKPGCSKSLSMQLIRSNLRGKDSKDAFLKTLPQLYCVSFQGSESSTSDGIIKVFDKAMKYQEHNSAADVLSVVILDEIGLAEISRFNPLKVLHSLLEPPNKACPDVAVVGISNWALDAAKMNRAIHLSRPDMDKDDLYETAKSISHSIMAPPSEDNDNLLFIKTASKNRSLPQTSDLLKNVSEAYHEYSIEQKFKNFHGLRDFYALTKHICKGLLRQDCNEEKKDYIVYNGILRNLGGLPTETESIKQIFSNHLGSQFHENIPVFALIKENMEDRSGRHLMLITSGDAVISVLEDMLKDMGREHVVIFGSHFEEDLTDDYNYRILSRIILCMEQGLVLILKDLENIYGSLYDMLNQNYTIVGNKKNCRIALGPYSNPMCHVHDDFKCIVLVEESKLDYSDPPFLNRFEKQHFRFSDMMDEASLQVTKKLTLFIDEFCNLPNLQTFPQDAFPIFGDDMLYSLILKKRKELDEPEMLVTECKKELMWVVKPEAVVRAQKTSLWQQNIEDIKYLYSFYMQLPLHDGIQGFLGEIEKTADCEKGDSETEAGISNGEKDVKMNESQLLFILFTHSNIHVNMNACCGKKTLQTEKLGAFKSEKQFSSKVKEFFDSERELLVVQCNDTKDSSHILLAKTIIENCRNHCLKENPLVAKKCISLIVHIDREETGQNPITRINFLSGWKLVMLDTIEKPPNNLPNIINRSAFQILNERRPLAVYVKEHLFWAFSRIKYSGSGQSIEKMMALMKDIQKSDNVLLCLENLVLSWIEQSSSLKQSRTWHLEIACNKNALYNSSSYIIALEKYLLDAIRNPLSMILFGLESASALSAMFVEDAVSSERFAAWESLIESQAFFNLKEIPEPSGPECYNCGTPALSLKMPFSYIVMQLVDGFHDDFADTVKKIKIACDLEDEELPKEIFLDLVTRYQDVILQGIPDINSTQYKGQEEDYIEDFCNFAAVSLSEKLEQNEKCRLIRHALTLFIDFETPSFPELITKLHAAYWTYTPVFKSIVQAFAVLKYITNTTVDHMLDNILHSDEEIDDEEDKDTSDLEYGQKVYEDSQTGPVLSCQTGPVLSSQEQLRTQLVKYLCKQLIPTKVVMDTLGSIGKWQQLSSKILPLVGNVSLNLEIIHALKFCNDLASILYIPFNLEMTKFIEIGNCILENNGCIQAQDVFQTFFILIEDLKEQMIPVKTLQRMICVYINRCFATDPDADHVYTLVLQKIAHDTYISTQLEYFEPILRNAVLMEQSVSENLFKDLLMDDDMTQENILLQALNDCISTRCSNGDPDSTLATLLVTVLEQHIYMDTITCDVVGSVTSVSDELIKIAFNSCAVLKSQSCTLKHVAAIAYLKRFLTCVFELLESSPSSVDDHTVPVLMNNVNGLLAHRSSHSKVEKHRSQCLVLYFLRIICFHCGLHQLNKTSKYLAAYLPILNDIEWDADITKASVLFHPLLCYIPDYQKCTNALIQLQNKKDVMFMELINQSKSDTTMMISLLGLLVHKFYLKSIVEDMKDSEMAVLSTIHGLTVKIGLPDIHTSVIHLLTRKSDFSHQIFQVSSESKQPEPQIASFLLHLMCCLTTFGERGNIFYDCTTKPEFVKTRYLPGFGGKSHSCLPHCYPVTCSCGVRYISKSGVCPQCSASSDSNCDKLSYSEELTPAVTGYPACEENTTKESTFHFFLQMIVHGCFMCCLGAEFSSKQTLSSVIPCEDIDHFLQDKLFRHWTILKQHLQMNDDDLCCFFHLTIWKMRSFFTSGLPLQQCQMENDREDLEQKMLVDFTELVDNRFADMKEFKQKHYEKLGIELNSVECQVQELTLISNQEQKDLTLPSLFRICETPSKDSLCSEISTKRLSYPILHLVMTSECLVLPQYIFPILKWHMAVVTIGSYKIRKMDCKDMNIGKFLTLEPVKSRKNLLKQRFDDFKQCWNELVKTHQTLLERIMQLKMPIDVISSGSKVADCLIFDDESLIYQIVLGLLEVQNSFMDKVLQVAFQFNCKSVNFLQSNDTVSLECVPFEDVTKADIIHFDWDDDWLKYSQCKTMPGEGKQIIFDLDKIEMEVGYELAFGKKHISLPKSMSKIIFLDELFQNSTQLLKDIRSSFKQENLTPEIVKGVENKEETDHTGIPELLTQLGMVLTLLKKTGTNEPDKSLVDYLEDWKSVIPPEAYIKLLPEPEHSLKLCHVVNLYQLLEEMMGGKMIEALDMCFRTELPSDAKQLLESIGKSHEKLLEKLQKALKVFVHRCLSNALNDVRDNQPLIDYIKDPVFWPQNTLLNDIVVVGVVQEPLKNILSPNLLVEHVYEAATFIQDFIEAQRKKDQRISSVVATYQYSKVGHGVKSKKGKIAKKGFGKT